MEFNAMSQFWLSAIGFFITVILPLWILGIVRKLRRDMEKNEGNRTAEFRMLLKKIAALEAKLDALAAKP